MTIEDIAALNREYLKPKDIAPILGCSQYTINMNPTPCPTRANKSTKHCGVRLP